MDGRKGAGDDARDDGFAGEGDEGATGSGTGFGGWSLRWMRLDKKPEKRLDARLCSSQNAVLGDSI